MPTSRLVPGRYPPPNTSPIADKIRERRGARGLTPLDGTLLHVPAVAEGWNTLLGAVRTKGKLSADVRELMILRVAAINHAAFEWIHHEHVGRDAGLTTEQLYLIRDTSSLPSSDNTVLSPLQSAALAFAHHSTTSVRVPPQVTLALTEALSTLPTASDSESADRSSATQDLLVEAAAITASYNMVSRFLVSLDVAAFSDNLVPWPYTFASHKIPLPIDPSKGVHADGHWLYAETYVVAPDAPWIVCSNSLLTTTAMWEWAIPFMLAPREQGKKKGYNVLLHDQRGHGKSSSPKSIPKSSPYHNESPPADADASIECTIPILAHDIALLITHSEIGIKSTVQAVIGVSQGGAAALAFAALYPTLAKGIVSCDTGPRTPEGNRGAWNERIELAHSHAGAEGMKKLADVTVPRWFPEPSRCSERFPLGQVVSTPASIEGRRTRSEVLNQMVSETQLAGFALGASALQDYDLISGKDMGTTTLLDSNIPALLVAGSLDGGGKVPAGMGKLRDSWNAKRSGGAGQEVKLEVIEGAGHLPMVDETEKWWNVVGDWLRQLDGN